MTLELIFPRFGDAPALGGDDRFEIAGISVVLGGQVLLGVRHIIRFAPATMTSIGPAPRPCGILI
jgi:hypothetical protein